VEEDKEGVGEGGRWRWAEGGSDKEGGERERESGVGEEDGERQIDS
jgi:hypothetical protein